MTEILVNKICKLEILSRSNLLFNDDNSPKNPNILSGVFFKNKDYYKNFGIYVSGLARTLKFIHEYNQEVESQSKIPEKDQTHHLERFVFLLFIDQNIRDDKKIMNIISSNKYTVPVLFNCPVYMKKHDDGREYHIDLFGTLIRFFPMFDFPYNPSTNSTVITIDIELNREDRRKVEAMMRNRPNGTTASGEIHNLIYKGEIPYVYSGTLCFNREKLGSELITKFIESAHSIVGTGHYGKRLTTFGYGIDEMFLNSHLIPAVKTYSIIIEYQISYFLYYSQPYMMKQKRQDVTHRMLRMILYDMYSPNLTIDSMFEIIRKSQFISDIKNMIKRQSREAGSIGDVSENELSGITIDTESTKNNETDTDLESEAVIDSEIVDVEARYTDTNKINVDESDSVMRKIMINLLGDMYDPEKSIDELLTLVDEKTYNVREKNEVNNALAERFYYIIHELVKNNDVWMERDVMRLIDAHLRNVISAYVLFDVDPDNKEVTDIRTMEPVYTDTVI